MTTAENRAESRRLWELFLLSLLSIYFELLVIRWLSADFRAFSVFKTFPLVTCFVGLGVGYALGNDRLFRLAPLALLKFVVIVQVLELVGFAFWTFPSVSVFNWVHYPPGEPLYLLAFIACLALLLMGPFSLMVCVGSRLGFLFDQFKPLTAYCVNIIGAMAGGIVYAVAAFAGFAPWILLVPVAALLLVYAPSRKAPVAIAAAVLAVGLAVFDPSVGPEVRTYWSPYHRLEVRRAQVEEVKDGTAPQDPGLEISTNRHFYQYAIDLQDEYVSREDLPEVQKLYRRQQAGYYNLPYRLKPAKDVLILGAGSGNDVAAALRNGARHVDAVDIDPVILRLGKESHPENPYADPRVHIYCADARQFMNSCRRRYDLVVFAGLDSHTVSGQSTSVRLDNYVYTKESLSRALSLLKDDGLMFLSFCKMAPWLSQRLYDTVRASAGYEPVVLVDYSDMSMIEEFTPWEVFLAGPQIKSGEFKLPSNLDPWRLEPTPGIKNIRIPTDDWPFIYVTPVALDAPYLVVLATVLGLSVFASRRFLFGKSIASDWQMFFLGAGFLLLELQSIARLSLLFGSTWFTSSVVINGVLLLILLANVIVIKWGDRLSSRQPLLYAMLFASLAASTLLAVDAIMSWQGVPYLSYLAVTMITLLPMFLAGLIFAAVFRTVPVSSRAIAFNLLGAVVGALLEYLSNYVGISGLVVVAAVLYAASLICAISGKSLKPMPDYPATGS